MQRAKRKEQSKSLFLSGSRCLSGGVPWERTSTTDAQSTHRGTESLYQFRQVSALVVLRLAIFSFLLFTFAFASAQDYSKFLHTSSKHASIGCNDCHRR